MSTETPTCPVCLEEYDLSVHLPKLIPSCHHSLCQDCLKKLIKLKNTRCPECRNDPSSPSKTMTFEDFPTNLSLKSSIEEKLKPHLCLKHGKELVYVCIIDGEKVCIDCALFEHKKTCASAQIKEMNDLKKQADKKTLALGDTLERLAPLIKKQEETFIQLRDQFQNIKFQKAFELINVLHKGAYEFLDGVRELMEGERRKTEIIKNLEKELRDRIEKCQAITSALNPRDIIELDDEELAERVEAELRRDTEPEREAFQEKSLEWSTLFEKTINEFKALFP